MDDWFFSLNVKSAMFGQKMHETQQRLIEGESDDEAISGMSNRKKKCRVLRYSIFLVFAVMIACFFGALGIAVGSGSRQQDLDKTCLARTSRASPITPEVQIEWQTVRFNGSLMKETLFRQSAGFEVDSAWESLGVNYRSVIVPAEQAEKVGLRQDQVKVSQKYGGGFPANIEGFHQLHCLNVLRQALWFNFEYYRDQGRGAFANNDFVLQKHVTHCLDIVRQQLMCTIDVGVLGQVWLQPGSARFPEAYVDFNTQHVCRNFEAVRQWAEKHQIPESTESDFLEPPHEGDRIYHTIP